MYKLHVPEWTDRNGDIHPERNLIVSLADTLKANEPPPHDLVFKYYGIPPREAFGPSEFDRFVFWNEDVGYIIVPDTPNNRNLWRSVNIS